MADVCPPIGGASPRSCSRWERSRLRHPCRRRATRGAITRTWDQAYFIATIGVELALVMAAAPAATAEAIWVARARGTLALWRFVIASDSLLAVLFTRKSFRVGEILWSVMFWDAVLTLFAAVLCEASTALAICTMQGDTVRSTESSRSCRGWKSWSAGSLASAS